MKEKEKNFVLVVDANEEILKLAKAKIKMFSDDIKIIGETDVENARYIFDSCHESLKAVFVGSGIASFTIEDAREPATLGFIREIRESGWEKPLVGFSGNPDFGAQMYNAGCTRIFSHKGYMVEEIVEALRNHDVIDIPNKEESATI
ncbi:TPA: hypothetical protein DCZ46_01630 [Candidatus Campbellbacteria bacterium]|nr:MAG: hypothetical protein UR58_C0001G0296 [Candidatus Campbellbacteria bacterium GW2011_OD1_34_28]KKP75218.1 MAG: hypothetical protein UR74_C0001G0074 [Candidatus Campbellbacteria bacterium GW2011_GWD2_35_24]KKP76221.1 MAG: hypothetical protein UR75_C0001G0255 [Candidatus Campbellbacteria bacterium GW2011_GWC2_35_28]KKP77410.1 MAG: hypothetical protein UR76_C0001G0255 [Candidatus Campbellbacteria bacterium GW2011_GWC1_35_31]KKP79339.1 MAG: hypothetical protein UR79_C0001G0255 [Candidatus Cam